METIKIVYQQFKVKDIEGLGHYVVREPIDEDTSNPGYLSTIIEKIGWFVCERDGDKYCLISMSDGMIVKTFKHKSDLVSHLNKSKSYRFATRKELNAVIKYQSNRWVEYL